MTEEYTDDQLDSFGASMVEIHNRHKAAKAAVVKEPEVKRLSTMDINLVGVCPNCLKTFELVLGQQYIEISNNSSCECCGADYSAKACFQCPNCNIVHELTLLAG
jgi:hypothetical protein